MFNWGYGDVVAKVSAIICTLLGALIGISTAQYNKDNGAGKHEPTYGEAIEDKEAAE